MLPVAPTAGWVESHGRKSLQRLGIDVIDLYQIHWPNPVVPISQQMEGMRRLQRAGVVIDVGVSNFSLARWRAAEDALGAPVLSNQVQYSLVARKPDAELVPYAQANDRLVIAYSPLGMGLLSGRYTSANPPKGSARLNNPLFLPENLDRAQPLIDAVRAVANAHDATPAQVALAWVISHPNVVAIPGASSVEQLETNIAAADLDLTIDELDSLTRRVRRVPPAHRRRRVRQGRQAPPHPPLEREQVRLRRRGARLRATAAGRRAAPPPPRGARRGRQYARSARHRARSTAAVRGRRARRRPRPHR